MTKNTRSQDNLISTLTVTSLQQLITDIVNTRTEQLMQEVFILKTQLDELKKTNQALLERLSSDVSEESQVSVILDQNFHSVNVEGNNTDSKITDKDMKKLEPNRKINVLKPQKSTMIDKSKQNVLKHKHAVMGNGTSDNENLAAAKRRIWLHVSRVRSDVTVDKIQNYLSSKCEHRNFIIEDISSTSPNSNKSFKVGADFELHDTLYSPDFWPSGIVVRRHNFFRRRKPVNDHQF